MICVFGVLKTKDGIKIRDEMLQWLEPLYDVLKIEQDPPGKLVEYPAIKFACQSAIEMNEPVLYLHTKGAANPNTWIQVPTRHVWKKEFGDKERAEKLFEIARDCPDPMVVCPFSGTGRETWFNGFIINPKAAKILLENLKKLLDTCNSNFLTNKAEITVECNPFDANEDFFKVLYACGVNRISMGLQSAIDSERQILGRLSDRNQVENAVKMAQKVGFENITLDVMLGVPNQTEKSLNETLDFCISLRVPHISAYMLKLEENTHFYKNQHKYSFPDDDLTADLYLQMCEVLENQGIMQYEISNFSKKGFENQTKY